MAGWVFAATSLQGGNPAEQFAALVGMVGRVGAVVGLVAEGVGTALAGMLAAQVLVHSGSGGEAAARGLGIAGLVATCVAMLASAIHRAGLATLQGFTGSWAIAVGIWGAATGYLVWRLAGAGAPSGSSGRSGAGGAR